MATDEELRFSVVIVVMAVAVFCGCCYWFMKGRYEIDSLRADGILSSLYSFDFNDFAFTYNGS